MNPPQATLKVVVLLHFILTVWASMSQGFMPPAYMYMNAIVLAIGIWSIAFPESSDSVLMLLVCNVFTILQDIIFLGIHQPRADSAYENPNSGVYDQRHEYRFSLGMCIVNLIIKPVTTFLLYRVYQERGGSYQDFAIPKGIPGFGGPAPGRYEDIDHSSPNKVETPAAVHEDQSHTDH